MNNRTLEKIRKCLALAESDNPGEASAALRQAQSLMRKHGVNATDLKLSEIGESLAKTANAKSQPGWVWLLMHTLSDVFAVDTLSRAYKQGGRTTSHAVFIGRGDAPKVASYAFEVLFRQLSRDRRQYLEGMSDRLKRATKTRKADLFAEAWVQSVRSKVEAIAMKDEDRDLINRYREINFKNVEKAKDRAHEVKPGDLRDLRAGYEAGSNAQIFQGMSARPEDEKIAQGKS